VAIAVDVAVGVDVAAAVDVAVDVAVAVEVAVAGEVEVGGTMTGSDWTVPESAGAVEVADTDGIVADGTASFVAGAVCAVGTVGDAAMAAAVGVTGLPTGGGSGPLDGASGAAAPATGTSRLNRSVINTAHAVRRPRRVSATCSRVVMRPSLRVRGVW